MDWSYVLFAIGQGIPALVAIAITIPIFALAGSTNRRWLASSASLACLFVFLLSCVLGGLPGIALSKPAGFIPLVGLIVILVFLGPSIYALRWRWLGALHLVTLAAAAYLWFIGSVAISHDSL